MNTKPFLTLKTKRVQDRTTPGNWRGGCLGGLFWAVLFELAGLLTIVLLVAAWRALHLLHL